jgi:bifunctional DNA-binding transcriptional regulator/antitoxin component of YhaV-PrlF toxin-antitoxin module
MTTTIALTSKNQCTIPKAFVEAAGLKPETQLRVTQIGNGLYITPIPEPTEAEFRRVLQLADTGKNFGKKEAKLLDGIIRKHRAKKQSRS